MVSRGASVRSGKLRLHLILEFGLLYIPSLVLGGSNISNPLFYPLDELVGEFIITCVIIWDLPTHSGKWVPHHS